MAPVRREPIRSAVVGSAVIPDRDIADIPLEAGVCFLRCSDDVSQISDDSIALALRDADDGCHEARVEEEAVPAGDGVCADERVFCGDGVAADWAAEGSRVVGLHVC